MDRGDWQTSTIGAVSKRVTKGTTPTTVGGRFTETGISYVKVESITEDGRFDGSKIAFIDEAANKLLSRSVLEENDILFTIAGTIGRVARVPYSILPANTNQAVGIVRPNTEIVDPAFLYYVLRDDARVMHAYTRVVQSVQANFSLKELSAIEVPLPPKSEQYVIAHILGTLDEKIDLNRRMNHTLESLTRTLFKSWFIDFDPVHSSCSDWSPTNDHPVDSVRCDVHSGWMVKTIGDLADIVGGSTPSTKETVYWEGGHHHWATPKDLASLTSPVLLHTERKITDAGLERISSRLLPVGTVLLSSRAPIGYLAINQVPVAINQGFIAMLPKPGVSNLYLLEWARAAHGDIVSRANGSTFLEISKANFRSIPVVMPNPEVMRAFDQLVQPMYARVVANLRESQILSTLRDTLLPKLISGELRIPDAERIVSETT